MDRLEGGKRGVSDRFGAQNGVADTLKGAEPLFGFHRMPEPASSSRLPSELLGYSFFDEGVPSTTDLQRCPVCLGLLILGAVKALHFGASTRVKEIPPQVPAICNQKAFLEAAAVRLHPSCKTCRQLGEPPLELWSFRELGRHVGVLGQWLFLRAGLILDQSVCSSFTQLVQSSISKKFTQRGPHGDYGPTGTKCQRRF